MPPQLLAGDAMPGYKVETCCPDRSCRGESGPDAGDDSRSKPDGGDLDETKIESIDGADGGDGVRHDRETEREQWIRRHHLYSQQ